MKITLLGDSIRQIGYGKEVPKLLGEDFEVYQPNENCRFAKYTLRGLFEWEADMRGTRIVHWNNGLWDVCDLFGDGAFTSESEYKETILRVADILLKRYDKVIFATTTPVTSQNAYNKNKTIKRYNKMVVPLLQEKGVIINDLYTPVASDVDKYIRKDDNIHLSDEGIKLCAGQVVSIIREVSKTIDMDVEKETAVINSNTGAPV